MNNTSLFRSSTPVHYNRTESNLLLGNTATTPMLSPNLLGAPTLLQAPSMTTRPLHKSETVARLDQFHRSDIPIANRNKTTNAFRCEDQRKLNSSNSAVNLFTISSNHPTSSSSSIFTYQPPVMTFTFDSASTTTIPCTNSLPLTKPSSFTFANIPTSSPSLVTLGDSSSLLPTSNASRPFPMSKAITRPSVEISSSTIPNLFSTMQSTSSVDLQLFQTMLNTQPFNSELAFLERQKKFNTNVDRARLRPKPSVLVSTSIPFLNSFSSQNFVSGKRKLTDSLLDDDDDLPKINSNLDGGPAVLARLSTISVKRPRMLDMNRIRPLVLANHEPPITAATEPLTRQQSDSLPTRWKQFAYTAASKQRDRAFQLPRLTQKDYYTEPAIEDLRAHFNEQGQCVVKQFTVVREHYGSVTFQGLQMNLAGLDLNRLIEIDRRQVTVYPADADRPVEGEELNCQAIISLLGVYPIDRSKLNDGEEVTDPQRLIAMNYGDYLEEMTRKFHGQFVSYDVYTGTWTFQVEHF